MQRLYGQDYKNSIIKDINKIRESVNSSAYSTLISNTAVSDSYANLRTKAENSAQLANTHICEVKGNLLALAYRLSLFYDETDIVSSSISKEASVICEKLDLLITVVNNLNSILACSKQYQGQVITPAAIIKACLPIRILKYDVYNSLLNLYNSDGSLNSESAAFVREFLQLFGLNNVSDDDLKAFYLVYMYLKSKGYSDVFINEHTVQIFNSTHFGQVVALNNNSSSAFNDCMNQLELELLKKRNDSDSLRYYLLVASLTDEHGCFCSNNLPSYYEFLEQLGIDTHNLSIEDIKGYLAVISYLRNNGYTDQQIYDLTPFIYRSDLLSSAYNVGCYDGQAQNHIIQNILLFAEQQFSASINEDLLNHFSYVSAGKNAGYSDPWTIIRSNASAADLAALASFYNTDPSSMSEREYRDLQISTMIILSRCLDGYHEGSGNSTAFDQWYGYTSTGGWCGIFVSWIMNEVGLLNGEGSMYSVQDNQNSLANIQSWGSTAFNFSNSSSPYYRNDRVHTISTREDLGNYTPHIGDICVVHNGAGHVCIVSGLIYENGELVGVYTNDGNAGNREDATNNSYIAVAGVRRDFQFNGGRNSLDFCDNYSIN